MKRFIICFIAILLTACSPRLIHDVTVKEIRVPVETPKELLVSCPITQPDHIKEFVNMTVDQRLDAVVNYAVKLVEDLKRCNTRIDKISDFQNKAVQAVNGENK